jgi:hypothetical protein
MQEIVALKISLRRFHTTHYNAKMLGLTFTRLTLTDATEDVTTDHLLVSNEAVRVLDRGA